SGGAFATTQNWGNCLPDSRRAGVSPLRPPARVMVLPARSTRQSATFWSVNRPSTEKGPVRITARRARHQLGCDRSSLQETAPHFHLHTEPVVERVVQGQEMAQLWRHRLLHLRAKQNLLVLLLRPVAATVEGM